MTDLSSENYVRLTTFTKDGRAKHTPVWIAGLHDGVLGTTTDDDSWKVKRLRASSSVELCPSDSRGNVADGVVASGGAGQIVGADDPSYLELEKAMIAKYGFQYRLFRFIRKLRRKTPCGILLKLSAG